MIYLEKMSVKFPELDIIANWRDETLETLRFSDLTAKGEAQRKWVESFSESEKYYFIYEVNGFDRIFIGYCGLDKIHSVNRTAEISLLISPKKRDSGFGTQAVRKLLEMGFNQFNLNCVYGECYTIIDIFLFWEKQGFKRESNLQARKFWNGRYYPSIMFSMTRQQWLELGNG